MVVVTLSESSNQEHFNIWNSVSIVTRVNLCGRLSGYFCSFRCWTWSKVRDLWGFRRSHQRSSHVYPTDNCKWHIETHHRRISTYSRSHFASGSCFVSRQPRSVGNPGLKITLSRGNSSPVLIISNWNITFCSCRNQQQPRSRGALKGKRILGSAFLLVKIILLALRGFQVLYITFKFDFCCWVQWVCEFSFSGGVHFFRWQQYQFISQLLCSSPD